MPGKKTLIGTRACFDQSNGIAVENRWFEGRISRPSMFFSRFPWFNRNVH
jgi:hypothetical protein